MKNKNTAGVLALFTGMLGVHRFYLGQRGLGILYFVATFMGVAITGATDGDIPVILAPLAIAFIDSILFFVMPKEDFDQRYNKNIATTPVSGQRFEREGYRAGQSVRRQRFERKVKKAFKDSHKRMGIEKFRDMDYLGAIESFQKSLKNNYESPSTHFNLACTYAMLELPKDAFFHIEKAVEFGFDAYEKIHNHKALAFLRTHPDFETFVKNNYKVITGLPAPQVDLLASTPGKEENRAVSGEEPFPTNDLLDQIMALGELKEKGLLTEEEFNTQKQKLLRD
ncbi:MAG TPA: NINE protein [Saprospiraceae bacterium]|nr:NINE protein [Saprospiraceae bacterium]